MWADVQHVKFSFGKNNYFIMVLWFCTPLSTQSLLGNEIQLSVQPESGHAHFDSIRAIMLPELYPVMHETNLTTTSCVAGVTPDCTGGVASLLLSCPDF